MIWKEVYTLIHFCNLSPTVDTIGHIMIELLKLLMGDGMGKSFQALP